MKTFKEFCESYLGEHSGETLIVVDIQPEYKKYMKFKLSDFCDHLIEEDYSKILYLFNGPDLGFGDSDEILKFLYEDGLDYDEEKIESLPTIKFFEKGYAFYRDMMDEDYSDSDIIKLIKYMLKHDYNTSEDLSDEEWKELDIEDLAPNRIFIPDVLDKLKDCNNIVLCGGGRNECLKEIEICLNVLNKPYKLLNKFIY